MILEILKQPCFNGAVFFVSLPKFTSLNATSIILFVYLIKDLVITNKQAINTCLGVFCMNLPMPYLCASFLTA
jgi:hypothetical protein